MVVMRNKVQYADKEADDGMKQCHNAMHIPYIESLLTL